MKSRIFILLCFALMVSCKPKQGCTDSKAINFDLEAKMENGSCIYPQRSDVTFSIVSPRVKDSIEVGTSVNIKADIESVYTIHGYELKMVDQTTDSILWMSQVHVHYNPVSIDTLWQPNFDDNMNLLLIVKVLVDHNSTEFTDTIDFNYGIAP